MSNLLSCSLIEKDKNGDILWSWTFPYVTDEQKEYILNKCCLKELKSSLYGRFNKNWFFINISDCDPKIIENVKQFGIIVWAKDFNAELYFKLASLLCTAYHDTGDTTKVLQLYLSVATKDISPNNNGSLLFKEFYNKHPYKSSRVKDLIKIFGLEVILIYNALLLKKKLVVYHHALPLLVEWLKSFPYFVPHINLEDNFIPWFELTDKDINELKDSTYYIAGCCENSIFSHTNLYDVLVNLPAKEINISPQSKDKLPITKTHKEIALFMEQLGNGDLEEEKVVAAIYAKTKELISLIRSMSSKTDDGKQVILLETLRGKNFSSTMENFIVQLASTENICLSN